MPHQPRQLPGQTPASPNRVWMTGWPKAKANTEVLAAPE